MVALSEKPDHQCQAQPGHQTADRDRTKACFLCEIILQVEIYPDKSAVAALAVVNGRVRRQEIPVVVLFIIGSDVSFAGGDLAQPIVLVFLANVETLHIVGSAELMVRAQVE